MQKTTGQSRMVSGRIMAVPVSAIRPNPAQPRKIFDQEGLKELAESIVQYGILQPLSIRRRGEGYELVAGERRLRAAKLAGLKQVPCILLTLDEAESGMVALVENLQRKDLDYLEQAQGIARLMRLYGLSQEQAALRIGKSQSAVANKLRLLRHTQPVLDALREHHLSERHARALLKLPTEPMRLDAISVIARRDLNVAASEAYIDSLLSAARPAPRRARFALKDVRLFLNAVNHNLELIQDAGIAAAKTQEETEQEIILTIRIPKKAVS